MKRNSASHEISLRSLMEGSIFALEQGGLLLHDSVFLYRSEKFSSACALALFAIEEIGRSRLLHQLWEEIAAKNEGQVTAQAIRRKCDNHIFKQFKGLTTPMLYIEKKNKKMYELFEATLVERATSESWRASAELHEVAKRLQRKLPKLRHEWRQKSLYVEPDESGSKWNRPRNLPKKVAFDSLFGANDAYSNTVRKFNCMQPFEEEASAFHCALEAWNECPELPPALSGKEIESLWEEALVD